MGWDREEWQAVSTALTHQYHGTCLRSPRSPRGAERCACARLCRLQTGPVDSGEAPLSGPHMAPSHRPQATEGPELCRPPSS